VIRSLALLLIVLAACAPVASSPSPSATPTASATSSASPAASTPLSATASPAASRTPIPLPTGAQVAAAGNGVVWMYLNGDHLFRSTDRGDTWTERTLPTTDGSGRIAFVSDRDGWFLSAAPAAAQCASQPITVWRTRDGAATWERLAPSGIDVARCKGVPSFVDTQRGYIPAYDESTAPKVYRTADGGTTWTLSNALPDPPGFTTRPGGFTLRPDVVADFGDVVLTDALALNDGSRVHAFRSTDRGATWTYVSTAPEPGISVVFITATRWLQIAAPSASRETTDGGRSWHAYASDYQQAAPVAPQIAFGDANTGYATVRGGLMRTTDGGAHWSALKTPGT
jgi:photosystem II stability/assembly factor-like uncharacterized protein